MHYKYTISSQIYKVKMVYLFNIASKDAVKPENNKTII